MKRGGGQQAIENGLLAGKKRGRMGRKADGDRIAADAVAEFFGGQMLGFDVSADAEVRTEWLDEKTGGQRFAKMKMRCSARPQNVTNLAFGRHGSIGPSVEGIHKTSTKLQANGTFCRGDFEDAAMLANGVFVKQASKFKRARQSGQRHDSREV